MTMEDHACAASLGPVRVVKRSVFRGLAVGNCSQFRRLGETKQSRGENVQGGEVKIIWAMNYHSREG